MSKYIEPKVIGGWRKGPPPSIGWWPASCCRNPRALRWWDGRRWSWAVAHDEGAAGAGSVALRCGTLQSSVEWCDRWWEVKA